MGQRIASLALEDPDFRVVGALERAAHPSIGKDYGKLLGTEESGVKVSETITCEADLLIDFSSPESTALRAKQAAGRGIGLVIGTTGLKEEHKARLASAGQKVPCLYAPNMSLGVNVLFRIAGEVAKILGNSTDVEIFEAHHNQKKDSPSGTAVRLAEVICETLGREYPEGVIYGREGMVGARPKGEIAVHAIRGGDIVGEHTVLFVGQGERIELVHRAQTRDIFARGALRAAKFVAGKPAGLYTMADVLEAELKG
jgi:4-hydroxy-tetrahydrodipicolinate reductase